MQKRDLKLGIVKHRMKQLNMHDADMERVSLRFSTLVCLSNVTFNTSYVDNFPLSLFFS